MVALGPPQPGPSRRDAHDGHVDRHHPLGRPAGWRIRVCRLAGRLELPVDRGPSCYDPASGDADYLGSGCPNGRAFDDRDPSTNPGRGGYPCTGDHTGANGIASTSRYGSALCDAERRARGQPDPDSDSHAQSIGRALGNTERDRRAHPLTHANTRALADGQTAHTATVG
jgi:hypothetical protein